jgi:hypothetical protein
MNYQEFLHTLHAKLTAQLDPDTTLQLQKISRNNGVTYDAFLMVNANVNLSPTIYVPPYYHRYLDGVNMESIVTDILDTYRKNLPVEDFDITLFTDYEKAQKRIVMRLVSYCRNEQLLADVPHKRFLDFAVIFYCLLESGSTQQAGILVHNHHLSLWDVDCETLYDAAIRNSPMLLEYRLDNMQEILEPVVKELYVSDDEEPFPMYILSNRDRTYGASVILYPGLLSRLADSFEKDLLILPSSVHEVLLLPLDDEPDMGYYSQMVNEVNETQLADEEILSDHAYYYSRKTRLMTAAPVA